MEFSNRNSNVRLASIQKLSYAVGHVYNDVCGTMWFTYVLVYLQFVMKLPPSTAGAILMVGQFVEATATPVSGMESDRIKGFGNYGRRKSTHIFGTILTTLTFPLVFIQLPGFDRASATALLVFYIPLVFIFKCGWASVQVSHLSLIPELSTDMNDRDDMTILRYVFNMASDMTVFFVAWAALSSPTPDETVTIDESDGWRFRNVALILVAIGLVFNGIFHIFTEEKPPEESPKGNASAMFPEMVHSYPLVMEKTVVSMKWSDWFREKHYFQVGMLVVISRLLVNLNQAFMPLFLQEGIRAPQEYLAIIPGVSQLSALMASLLVKLVLHYATKKTAFIMGTCLTFAGCMWLGFDSPEAVRSGNIFGVSALLGAGIGMMVVTSTSFISDLIGENTESGAYVFGSIAFIQNLLGGLLVFLVQTGHGLCDENCPTYYRHVIANGLSSFALLSLALVLCLSPKLLGKRLSDENTFEGRAGLAQRKISKKYGSTRTGFPIIGDNIS